MRVAEVDRADRVEPGQFLVVHRAADDESQAALDALFSR